MDKGRRRTTCRPVFDWDSAKFRETATTSLTPGPCSLRIRSVSYLDIRLNKGFNMAIVYDSLIKPRELRTKGEVR